MKLKSVAIASILCSVQGAALAFEDVIIRDVPDYTWYAGCFGTASGNLMGFWDRNGFPNMYDGPANGGVAPLDSIGANAGIRSLWANKAGFDGRPQNMPGHLDDYWEYFEDETRYSYESSATDPYELAGRQEHQPDCVGDFIGASQNKWQNLDGECSGNIDAFSFNFWDKSGARRKNFIPPEDAGGKRIRDIQSGWIEWSKSRGYQADTFSQLVEFNPEIPPGTGFSFEDLKAEIDAGYPVMIFLQNPGEYSRAFPGMELGGNPEVHGMLAYGYLISDSGAKVVRYRTSWGDGDQRLALWSSGYWEAQLAVRGMIGYHPLPKITEVSREGNSLRVKWAGPSATLVDRTTGQTWPAHRYVLERSSTLDAGAFQSAGEPVAGNETLIPASSTSTEFYRVKLIGN
jgi:hypothetical protein